MPILYLDVLIVLNWLIDGLLLSVTARLCGVSVRRWRLAVASLIGGVASCQILLEIPAVLSLLLHIIVAAVMVRTAFPYRTWRVFLRHGVVLFCLSALLSGVVTALWYLTESDVITTHNGVIYCEISPLMLTAFALLGYGVIRLYDRLTRHRKPATLEYVVTVDDGDGEREYRALYDTGLHLREPFSDRPVIVIKQTDPSVAPSRIRMIPYHTVGGTGLLPAFMPHRVTVRTRGTPPQDVTGVYVALSDAEDHGEYTALIGADVLEGVRKR